MAADLIAALPYAGTYSLIATTNSIPMPTIQSNQVAHLRRFATTIEMLETLSEKELAQQCFSSEDEEFIDALMEQHQRITSGGPWRYSGWYPQLFYRAIYWTDDIEFHGLYGSGAFDGLVADVHTDVPNVNPPDPGSVLHEAVGRVNLLMIAVDNGSDRFVCAGPVLSHYEFEIIGAPRRLNDKEWQAMILWSNLPPDIPASGIEGLAPPVWTKSYLVPRPPQ